MSNSSKPSIGRREFLRTIGAGAAIATAAPLVGEANADTETAEEKRKSRYQESDEVKTYYRVNRYPAS